MTHFQLNVKKRYRRLTPFQIGKKEGMEERRELNAYEKKFLHPKLIKGFQEGKKEVE